MFTLINKQKSSACILKIYSRYRSEYIHTYLRKYILHMKLLIENIFFLYIYIYNKYIFVYILRICFFIRVSFLFPFSFAFPSQQRFPLWEYDRSHSLLWYIAFARGSREAAENLCRYSRPSKKLRRSDSLWKMTSRGVSMCRLRTGAYSFGYWPSCLLGWLPEPDISHTKKIYTQNIYKTYDIFSKKSCIITI